MKKAFAKALRTTRKARRLTQEDFAGVSSRTYLSSLERGRQSPTLDKVAMLAETIGVHPLSLLTLACLYSDGVIGVDALFAKVRKEIAPQGTNRPVIRLLITDDHEITRDGLRHLFALVADIEIAGEACSGEECLARLAAGDIDLLLLDMAMPGLCGKELIATVRARHPTLPVLVFSMHVEPHVAREAIEAGANGYVAKDQDAETLLAAVRAVAEGRSCVVADHPAGPTQRTKGFPYSKISIGRQRPSSSRITIAAIMKSDLPLVAIVAEDPRTAATISLIIGDLCRIDDCRNLSEIGACGEYPTLILAAVEVQGLHRCGPGRTPAPTSVPGSPLIYVLMAETRNGNDGVELHDCLATTRQPEQFRAVVEARLGVPAPPGASLRRSAGQSHPYTRRIDSYSEFSAAR